MKGQIVKIISNLYFVNTDNKVYECRSRGVFKNRNITPVVGDFCIFDEKEKYIKEILPRKNFLIRPFVSNIDQGLIVTSLRVPEFSENLLDKLITIMEINKIKPIICITKEDLVSREEKIKYRRIMDYYESIGYLVIYNYEVDKLKSIFKDKTTVFTGQTGAGKSSLFNKLDESLDFKVGEVSLALGRGKHTTRHVELINIFGGKLVDTPGFSDINLKIYTKEELKNSFKEFSNYDCKYRDCFHDKESIEECAVKKMVQEKEILQTRYDNYLKFIK